MFPTWPLHHLGTPPENLQGLSRPFPNTVPIFGGHKCLANRGGGIRTHNKRILSPSPLPVGLHPLACPEWGSNPQPQKDPVLNAARIPVSPSGRGGKGTGIFWGRNSSAFPERKVGELNSQGLITSTRFECAAVANRLDLPYDCRDRVRNRLQSMLEVGFEPTTTAF